MKVRLNTGGKYLIVIVLGIIAAFVLGVPQTAMNFFKKDGGTTVAQNSSTEQHQEEQKQDDPVPPADDKNTIRLSLDEWIGWKPIIDANGGFETQRGSIYDKLGIRVSIKPMNDATLSSTALIGKKIDAAGYTINRIAFLQKIFKEGDMKFVIPYISNFSNGGDGIVARKDIKTIRDLIGRRIAVPKFSEAQTLVWWLVEKSDLTEAEKEKLLSKKNIVLVDTPDVAAKAFQSGEVDAAATWEPNMSDIVNDPKQNARIMFSTKAANNLIMDAILFNRDFYDSHIEAVGKLILGALMASKEYSTNMSALRATATGFPLLGGLNQTQLKEMTSLAALATYKENMDLLDEGGSAEILFTDMTSVWNKVGEQIKMADPEKIFDTQALRSIKDKINNTDIQISKAPIFTPEKKEAAANQDFAILSKHLSLEFKVNSDEFSNKKDAYAVMNAIAKQAKLVEGMYIQIEGNTSSDGNANKNLTLSKKRAQAVAAYLEAVGIDGSRMIVKGNGSFKPVADNNTEAGRKANRRTDIFFKQVQ